MANLAKMAKTKRRNNKVRRTRSRRGGGPFTSFIIKGKTYGANDTVPDKDRHWIPYHGTAANHGFKFTMPNISRPSFSSGVAKPPKTDLQKREKSLRKEYEANLFKITRNDPTNLYAKYTLHRDYNNALDAARTMDQAKNYAEMGKLRKTAQYLGNRVSSLAHQAIIKAGLAHKYDHVSYNKEQLTNSPRLLNELTEGISQSDLNSIDWNNLKRLTKQTDGKVWVEMEDPLPSYMIVTEEHKLANPTWYRELSSAD